MEAMDLKKRIKHISSDTFWRTKTRFEKIKSLYTCMLESTTERRNEQKGMDKSGGKVEK